MSNQSELDPNRQDPCAESLASARDHSSVKHAVAERTRAEEAARENQTRYQRLFEMESDAIVLVDNETGQILEVNPAAYALYGYNRAEWLRMNHIDVSAEPAQTRLATLEGLKQVPLRWHRKRDGTVFPVEIASSHFEWQGRNVHLAAIRDITQRVEAEKTLRRSEERFRTLVESDPEAVFIQAGDRFIYLNPAALNLFGGERPEQLIGEPVLDRFHPDSQKRVGERICRINELGRTASRLEETCLKLDGTPVPVEVDAVPFHHQGQDGGLVFVRDLTERKRLEQERTAMEFRLRHQQRLESMGTLASGVAHEINNPINGIMNYAQLIQDRLPTGSALTEYTSEILKETQRVATIVHNLLTFARNAEQTHSPARMAEIIEGALSLIRTVIRQDQITLVMSVPADLPELKCHSQQLRQVLMNLMTNARDALNERYPGHDENKIMRISAHVFKRDGRRWIRTTVEDHGAGITPEVRERMFDPFFTTKPRDKGSGLGLAISHGIVKEHQGEWTVESEPGNFTRMHVDLPVDREWSLKPEVARESAL